MEFYERVKRLAKTKSHSLQEFIISVGLNHDTYYSQKTAGNLPRLEDALQIAQALGTSIEYLVMGIEPKPLSAEDTLDEIQFLIEKFHKQSGKQIKKKR